MKQLVSVILIHLCCAVPAMACIGQLHALHKIDAYKIARANDSLKKDLSFVVDALQALSQTKFSGIECTRWDDLVGEARRVGLFADAKSRYLAAESLGPGLRTDDIIKFAWLYENLLIFFEELPQTDPVATPKKEEDLAV